MSLYDLNSVKTVNVGRSKIEELVLDSPYLYWINRETNVIERFNLSSTDSNPEVSVIAELANNVTGMCVYHIL